MFRNIKAGIKWYLKGLFPPKLIIPLYSIILFFDVLFYIHISGLTDPQAKINTLFIIIATTSLFLNPLILASGIAHVARTKDLTIYELSMISSWLAVALARLVALYLYITPYLVIQLILLYLSTTASNIIGAEIMLLTIAMLLFYCSLGMLLTISGSRVVAVIGLSMTTFLLPISTWILVSVSQLSGIKSFDDVTSIMLYLFNSPMAYMFDKVYGVKLSTSWIQGGKATFYVTLFLLILYIYVFTRKQELKI
jgi:hypothetical protein